MTTVGLELTNFIDPSLTWKTVSKGRSTSRRSRNMKLFQDQEKRSPKRQSSEGSEKSNMIQGRRSMEHIPIKKRRLFLRSPSPPLQSDNMQGESDEVVGGQCTSDLGAGSDVSLESQPVKNNDSNGYRTKNNNSDGIIDEGSVKSSAEIRGTGDDFSGIAILAAAACCDRLDNSSDAAGKSHSQLGGLLDKQHELFVAASDVKENVANTSSELAGKSHSQLGGLLDKPHESFVVASEVKENITNTQSSELAGKSRSQFGGLLDKQHESFVVASDVKENITSTQSSELVGKDDNHAEEACVDRAEDIVQFSVNKESDDVVMCSINESQKVEQTESIAFTSVGKESIECISLPSSLRNNDDVKEPVFDLQNEVADRTPENSGTSRDCRLHWDLNTVMDEWDDPVEDTCVVSSAQVLDLSPINVTNSQNLENVDVCKANESEIQNLENVEGSESMRTEATESCDNVTTQVEVCAEPERTSGAGFSSLSPSISRVEQCSELPSGFVTSILKDNPPSNANDHNEEAPVLVTDSKIQNMGVNEDISIDRPLSLGLNDIKILASDLEDGELREPSCWEDDECEELETEHVDYDSDNRDGIDFYAGANDFVQSSGEVLVRECEKPSYRSDNFSSNDRRSNEENCSLRFEGCLSTMDSTEAAACTKIESPVLNACSGAIDTDKVQVDQKDCRSSIEADSVGKDFENDPPRDAREASDSGRDLEFPDRRCADSMRRSRSSNFDSMHNSGGRDESVSQEPSVRMGRFGGRTWNPEEKSIVGNTASEDDSERIIRTTGDTSPIRSRRPRIINTSRSGYHFVRRGSPGEGGDGDYGMGMVKVRDFRPDNNPRNRFGRFNGMGRGDLREGYRRPNVYDPPKSVGGVMNRFAKRDRSFSPLGDRFHRKSRSRSRTRSPVFRSEARMGRGRLPYQQQSDRAAEHPRERRSPPLRVFNQSQRFDTMGSPGRLRSDECIRPPMRPMRFHDTTTSGRGHDFDEGDDFRRKPILTRNHRRSRSRSRSCSPDFRSDTRMGPMRVPYQQPADQIRQRRSSPVRVFRPLQRYEAGGSPVRIRSDECSRPMVRPLRFPDSTLPGRGHDFNNNNSNVNGDGYRRKPRNIFERIHPVRHYDMEGDIRRLPYEEEGAGAQNFRRNENYVRGPCERRPVEFRGPREERGNVRYNNNSNNNNNNSDRVFYSGPKQQFGVGMRDYADEEGIPRRVRP